MRVVLLVTTVLLTGCVELRTPMVNKTTGKEMVCEGHGRPFDARMVHDQCVNAARLQGYQVKTQ